MKETMKPEVEIYSEQKTPKSVNYHFTRLCNYSCGFCFHTQKTSFILPLEKAIYGLKLLKEAGTQKINFAGGEPFTQPKFLGELIRQCKENIGINKVSVITNGSLVKKSFFEKFGKYIDVFGVSCDSFIAETNIKIGRGRKGDNVKKLFELRELCKEYNIKFKLNTVVCSYNKDENMVENIKKLDPYRWKVFQVLLVKGENEGGDKLRDVTRFQITNEEFEQFKKRHEELSCMVPESNDSMKSSYLILDEYMRFLDKGDGEEIHSESILDVGVNKALEAIYYDEKEFIKRKGDYLFNDRDPCLQCQIKKEVLGDF
jgi:radical S-adenosyl methionine domain-containing protein 2